MYICIFYAEFSRMHALSPKYYSLFSLLLILFSVPAFAQTESDERALIQAKDGISISDSLFLLNIRFRMQNRAGFNTREAYSPEVQAFEARVRRLRLRFDGYVLTPRIQYYIQLSFSRADQDLETGTIAQTVRDAILYYTFNDRFYVGFGQSKLPGNRQRVISSGNLQFADRSIANSLFTLDRDFGFFTYYTQPFGKQQLLLVKTALSTGDGRNAQAIDNGLAYTGRLEWLPFGRFNDNGDYSEGDLFFEPRPKFSLAATYSLNHKATRTGGQLGLALFAPSNINTLIIDAMYKYSGWAFMGEYFNRKASNPVTTENGGSTVRYVYEGIGYNAQLSRMISRKTELAGRYTRVEPGAAIQPFDRPTEEIYLGITRYLRGHRIKAQGNIGYRWRSHQIEFRAPGNQWLGMVQVEFGI
jgi:phosphate-selective porin OprO and OprP